MKVCLIRYTWAWWPLENPYNNQSKGTYRRAYYNYCWDELNLDENLHTVWLLQKLKCLVHVFQLNFMSQKFIKLNILWERRNPLSRSTWTDFLGDSLVIIPKNLPYWCICQLLRECLTGLWSLRRSILLVFYQTREPLNWCPRSGHLLYQVPSTSLFPDRKRQFLSMVLTSK